ncbi:hypothetical protein ACP70R_040825 [Stipagrostis hirtigluma subsp. patula]
MEDQPPCVCCHCQQVIYVYVGDDGNGGRGGGGDPGGEGDYMVWLRQLVAEDFSATCARDHECGACRTAFCGHCCGDHHQGHAGVVAAAKAEAEGEGSAAAAAKEEENDDEGKRRRRHRRDSFCIACRVAFCSELCAHHGGGEGHEVMRVDEYGERHFARCTGEEPWFHDAFGGIETYEDKDGNLMIPLQRRRTPELVPEPGLKFSTRHP